MGDTHIAPMGIIYCPKQGVRRSQKRWERIKEMLDARGVAYDFVQSESLDGVARLTRMLVAGGCRTLVVVGGDSALNQALNALAGMGGEAVEQVALGVVPNGRGNDFAAFWGFSEDSDEQTVDALVKRRLRRVDVGCLHSSSGEHYFLNCVNVGLVANIMKLKYKTRRILGLSVLSYFASMFLLLFQRLETRMHLQVNEEHIERKVMSVCVGNSRGYGQTPNAVPYNGMLDVTVIVQPEVRQLLEGMWMLLTGKFLNHKDVRAYRTERPVWFHQTRSATVSADGMVMKGLESPFEISLKHELVNFIIPG